MRDLTDFYRGKAWRELRQRLIIERQNDKGELLCEHCHKPIVNMSACIGHHKEPITESNVNEWAVALNPDNVSLVHARCHNEIHERYGFAPVRKVYIVYGSACSGKTSYVNNNKRDGDLIIDLDNIYQALTGDERYINNQKIKPVVFAVREAIYDQIKMRVGMWRTAWVIGSFPFQRDRENLCQYLGAETIFIQATKEECLQRLENDKSRENVREQWAEYINEWFEDFQADEDFIPRECSADFIF